MNATSNSKIKKDTALEQRHNFFDTALSGVDFKIKEAIDKELVRQQNSIELIASENIVSYAVMEAQGSVMTNKYAEGYARRRYYNGCDHVDTVEEIAIERAKKMFGCQFANVQPHSGSQANQAVFFALLKPGDTILGMSLDAGGHLTHGAPPNESGKWFNAVQYGVKREDYLIDYDEVERLALEHKPKMIIAGASAYPRQIDFKRFRSIADKVGAYLMADVAHYAGLIVGGVYANPFPYAHVVTTTTHKTLRGPRGGMVLTNDETVAKKINSAVFPGLQGGPLMHVIAAKAVAFGEALHPTYKQYIKDVSDNAKVLAKTLITGGLDVLTGGTECHMVLIDLRNKGVTGKDVANGLDEIGITCNKNGVPFDDQKFTITSGIRLGTPAATTRGFGAREFRLVGDVICRYVDGLADYQNKGPARQKQFDKLCETLKAEIKELCDQFPIYGFKEETPEQALQKE
jgi:glycine hydroxymethyltransferase